MATRYAESKFEAADKRGIVHVCLSLRMGRPVETRTYMVQTDGKWRNVTKAEYRKIEAEARETKGPA